MITEHDDDEAGDDNDDDGDAYNDNTEDGTDDDDDDENDGNDDGVGGNDDAKLRADPIPARHGTATNQLRNATNRWRKGVVALPPRLNHGIHSCRRAHTARGHYTPTATPTHVCAHTHVLHAPTQMAPASHTATPLPARAPRTAPMCARRMPVPAAVKCDVLAATATAP